ncbi:DUF805 domain-containing protein [Denitromonas ohlonensis]|uniref:DUF805 domain-containing protein n=2 Tax=Denitromonas TaxID=139331 RepID=A0A558CIA4_9RHOO|nr:DUF805 domain-containing protein [Denitromonas ohlonensis]TVO69434.1 DUF805 domain-containing protein [Denitromonas ohlonensis]TVO77534.1 DUF805 domain-containing protein [Denitromonas ohlonensis]TVT48490.1 MAG: DUF805 domain-containing protein [Denitromonas halophila]TVT73071.1 MAG: DUF805 domain-containing protein [Denitromonas halophila]
MTQYKLVFSGDILPGHDPEVVKAQLAAMLKVAPEQTPRLFSGKRVTLRKGLDTEKAQAYRRKLAAMGVGIRVEADVPEPVITPPSATTPATDVSTMAPDTPPPPTRATPAALDLVPTSDEPAGDMDCPECGHRQPRRTLCLNCGCDMPRVLAAREHQAQEAQAGVSTTQHSSLRIHAGDAAVVETEAVPLFGTDFGGRISRRSYFAGSMLLTSALIWLAILGIRLESLLVLGLCAVVAVFFGARLSILRCHDFDWRGWWVLITAIPYVGGLFSLLLMFLPGSKGDNNFGPQPTPTSWIGAIGSIVFVAVSSSLAFNFFADDVYETATRYNQTSSIERAPAVSGMQSTALHGYDPERDHITMYSLTTCGYCDQKRAQFDDLGIRYREVFIDTDPSAQKLMWSKLRASGWKDGGVGTPTLEVNGVMLPNNPSLKQMSQHFLSRSRRSS